MDVTYVSSPAATAANLDRQRNLRIYYLHPLLAGPIDRWSAHFARIRRMGFSHVLIAPPFVPSRCGNVLLVADHDELHPALGGGPALPGLRQVAESARANGVELMLDIVLDRVARESPLAPSVIDDDLLPDPRRTPEYRYAASLRIDTARYFDWWQDRLTAWLDAGIAGFRCDAAHRSPASVWSALIDRTRANHPSACFLAWIIGTAASQVRSLMQCGFDLASSSSWAWDFREDWLDADTRRTAAVGHVLAMPELPYGARIAASNQGRPACERALSFAARFGEAWLMPMGFEYGATACLDAARGRPIDFDDLMERPRFDLSPRIVEANSECAAFLKAGPARTISAPHAEVAVVTRRAANTTHLILVNPFLDRSVRPQTELLQPRLAAAVGGQAFGSPEWTDLQPGEVRLSGASIPEGIVTAKRHRPAVEAAVRAPRIAIVAISPSVDRGKFPAKRRVGDLVRFTADIVSDGHDRLAAAVSWRQADTQRWREIRMRPLANDVWEAELRLERPGRVMYTIDAWVDVFGTYRDALVKRHAASVPLDLEQGRDLVAHNAGTSHHPDIAALLARLDAANETDRLTLLLAQETAQVMRETDPRLFRIRHTPPLVLDVDREAGAFASWYELFPRSQSGTPMRHGTFNDVIARLPAIQDMGFDVLYFPPIHPIGRQNRKGRNNALHAEPGDPGSPYAIGSPDGGHDAIHPELGTLDDFRRLLVAARRAELEIALDFAIQCSPDHPWLRDHPKWFTWQSDGSVRYAENPPKKYEDIVAVDFYGAESTPALWLALRDIVLFWVNEGIRIFRVDNPHTKPLPFWEWMIADIRCRFPETIFLAEAFTRPKMMYQLAKIGFSQSYTYFTWRETAEEVRNYVMELTTEAPLEFFRPHFFVNTPDINPRFLHHSGRPGFLIRAALAALLSGLWGIYNGFELCEAASLGSREEYLNSEKYEIRGWDWNRPGNIVAEIRQLNHIRRANPALHTHLNVAFLPSSDRDVLCFVKATPTGDNVIVAAVSFDPHTPHGTEMEFDPALLGMPAEAPLIAEDLMRGSVEHWHMGNRYIYLDPADLPFGVWRIRANDRATP